jgi:hypothetical protein
MKPIQADCFSYSTIATLHYDEAEAVYIIRHNTERIHAHGETLEEAETLFKAMLSSMDAYKARGKWGGSRSNSGRTQKWGE